MSWVKHTEEQVRAWHLEYMDHTVPATSVARKYGVKHFTMLNRFRKLGLPLRPAGFRPNNCRGKNGENIARLRYLWLYKFAYKRRARRKGLDFTLSEDEFISLVTSSCDYCGKSYLDETRTAYKAKINMLTVDRVNSDLGYVLDNCVPCCKICNTIKMDASKERFLKHIETIILYQKAKVGHL